MPSGDSPMPRHRGDDSASPWTSLTYQLANRPSQRLAALRLVYRRYARAGLVEPSQLKLRVTPQHLLPSTSVFVGLDGKSVYCTASLIGDGDDGMPLESIYGPEVRQLRRQGKRLAEVSCLAFAESCPSINFRSAFVRLVAVLAKFARCHQIDCLLMTTHPRHFAFYERLMGFEQVGGVKHYPKVLDRLAVAGCLEFDSPRVKSSPFQRKVFDGVPLPPDDLLPYHVTTAEQRLMRIALAHPGRSTLLPLSA